MNRAFINAVEDNNVDFIRRALLDGADVHQIIAATRGYEDLYSVELIDLLREAGGVELAEISQEQRAERSRDIQERALFTAVDDNNISEVLRLLEAGVNIHASDDYALKIASIEGTIEMVRILLENGANVNAVDMENNSALREAIFHQHINIVRLLLDHGATINILDNQDIIDIQNMNNAPLTALLREHGVNIPRRRRAARITEERRRAARITEERRRAALEQEERNEQLRAIAIDEVKNREEKAPENPFVDAHCSSTENLYGDPLKDADDIVIFEIGGNKGDCYLKEELKLLQSDQYVRGVGEKAYKLPWSNIWITKSLKEFAERMEGHGPIPLQRSDNFVGYNRNNILWILQEN